VSESAILYHTPHHNRLRPFIRDHQGEPVPDENFWTLWRKGRLTEADTLIIRPGATQSGLSSAHLHHPPIFLQAGCPFCSPTNSVKALKATSAFGLRRRHYSSPQRCYLHRLHIIRYRELRTENKELSSSLTAHCSVPQKGGFAVKSNNHWQKINLKCNCLETEGQKFSAGHRRPEAVNSPTGLEKTAIICKERG